MPGATGHLLKPLNLRTSEAGSRGHVSVQQSRPPSHGSRLKRTARFTLTLAGALRSLPDLSAVHAEVTPAELESMTARFAPAPLRVETSKLSPGDRAALVKLIEAGRVVNRIFLQQIWSGNPALEDKLAKDKSAQG